MSLRNDMSKHRLFVQTLVKAEHDNIKNYLSQLRQHAGIELEKGTYGGVLTSRLRDVMSSLPDTTLANMADIADYEARFAVKTFSKYFDGDIVTPTTASLKKGLVGENMSINNVSFKNGVAVANNEGAARKSLITAYKQYGQRKADEVVQALRDAQIQGLTRAETLKAVDELINGMQTAQARTLADTAINYTTNIAKDQVMQENRDILEQEIWVTDIELNTCDECQGYEDEGAQPAGSFPTPAIHWGCQCEVVPYVE